MRNIPSLYRPLLACLMLSSLWTAPENARAQRISSRPGTSAGNDAEADSRVPALRWFTDQRGYEQALEIQKETEADLFIVFYREDVSNERGLYNWLDTRGLQTPQVRKHLRELVKVRVDAGRRVNEQLVANFRVHKTPAVFIAKPGGHLRNRCNFFDYEEKRPRLLEPDQIVQIIKEQQEFSPWAKPGEKKPEQTPEAPEQTERR